jgi:hypothetical protein
MVDDGKGGAASRNADEDEREIGVVKKCVHETTEADIEKVTGRMGLVDAGVEAAHCKREVYGVQVVEIAAAKYPSGKSNHQEERD